MNLTLLALLAPLAAPTPQDDLPTADEVVAAMQASLDPDGRAAAATTQRHRGTLEFVGFPSSGTFDELLHRDGRVHDRMAMGDFGATLRGYDGERGWFLDPMSGVDYVDGQMLDELQRDAAVHRAAPLTEAYARIEVVGRATRGERGCLELRLHPHTGEPDTWFVEEATGLPYQQEIQRHNLSGSAMRLTATHEAWGELDGVLRPTRMRIDFGGFAMIRELTSAELDPELPATAFDIAPEFFDAYEKQAQREAGTFEVEVREQREQLTASMTVTCPRDEVGNKLYEIFPAVVMHLNQVGGTAVGAPFVRFHDRGDPMTIEAGMGISEPIEANDRIAASTLPGGWVASAWHVGPYETIEESYDKLYAWLETSEYEDAGAPWQVYWTDPGLEPDPAKWRTEILVPVRHRAEGDAAIVIDEMAERHTATIRVTCKLEEIGPVMGELLPEVMLYLKSIDADVVGAPFARYHAFGPDELDIECGMMVAEPVPDQGRIRASTLPAGPVARSWHVGPYEELHKTYGRVGAWLAEQGRTCPGGQWEIYWTDPGTERDPQKWRTEVYFPLEPLESGAPRR